MMACSKAHCKSFQKKSALTHPAHVPSMIKHMNDTFLRERKRSITLMPVNFLKNVWLSSFLKKSPQLSQIYKNLISEAIGQSWDLICSK